jgi:hypothetical protein
VILALVRALNRILRRRQQSSPSLSASVPRVGAVNPAAATTGTATSGSRFAREIGRDPGSALREPVRAIRAVGHERQKEALYQSGSAPVRHHQPRSHRSRWVTVAAAKRCRGGQNTWDSEKDQTDRAEHLRHADEPHEQARQWYLLRQHLDRENQLHSTGEQKDEREQPLSEYRSLKYSLNSSSTLGDSRRGPSKKPSSVTIIDEITVLISILRVLPNVAAHPIVVRRDQKSTTGLLSAKKICVRRSVPPRRRSRTIAPAPSGATDPQLSCDCGVCGPPLRYKLL